MGWHVPSWSVVFTPYFPVCHGCSSRDVAVVWGSPATRQGALTGVVRTVRPAVRPRESAIDDSRGPGCGVHARPRHEALAHRAGSWGTWPRAAAATRSHLPPHAQERLRRGPPPELCVRRWSRLRGSAAAASLGLTCDVPSVRRRQLQFRSGHEPRPTTASKCTGSAISLVTAGGRPNREGEPRLSPNAGEVVRSSVLGNGTDTSTIEKRSVSPNRGGRHPSGSRHGLAAPSTSRSTLRSSRARCGRPGSSSGTGCGRTAVTAHAEGAPPGPAPGTLASTEVRAAARARPREQAGDLALARLMSPRSPAR